jgi:hypothetical protein
LVGLETLEKIGFDSPAPSDEMEVSDLSLGNPFLLPLFNPQFARADDDFWRINGRDKRSEPFRGARCDCSNH